MAGLLISLLLASGMFAAIWVLVRVRGSRAEAQHLPGQLTAAERRQLYKRLGINPATMARQSRSNVIWLDPKRAGRPRTEA